MNLLQEVEQAQRKAPKDLPKFNVGDTVRVHFRIVEGEKERIQVYEGVVIAKKNGTTANARFTVRRVAFGEGVERVIPLHSPRVEKVEVVREGRVRRAKLYYLRERAGKAARVRAKGRGGAASLDDVASADQLSDEVAAAVVAEAAAKETEEAKS